MPASLLLFIWSVEHFVRHASSESALIAAGLFVLLLAIFKTRIYSLKVQDRLIRLEERLRLAALCSGDLKARIPELTERQLIALRFASDGEAPALAARALDENMEPKQIKEAIKNWRGDYFRV